MGIPTFMRAPVVSVEKACAPSDGRSNGLDVAMIGTPRGGSAASYCRFALLRIHFIP